MRLAFGTVAALLVSAVPAFAGPLPWNHYVRFGAADGADNILLGTDTRTTYDSVTGVETSTPVFLIYRTGGFGPSRIDFQTQPGTSGLFSFGYGDWDIVESLPEHTVANRFTLSYGFGNSPDATGVVEGTISADGAFTSGTGNFLIGLSEDRDLLVGSQHARLDFGTRGSESASYIEMTITPIPPVAETPEPATLALAGLGIAGVLGARLRAARRLRTA